MSAMDVQTDQDESEQISDSCVCCFCLKVYCMKQTFSSRPVQFINTAQLTQEPLPKETETTSSTAEGENATEGIVPWLSDSGPKYHFGVGCDSCGMYPIIGNRYRCSNCMEAIGFDLCGDCYNTRSKLPGRFNQQHKPGHTFNKIESTISQITIAVWNRQHGSNFDFRILTDNEQEPSETQFLDL